MGRSASRMRAVRAAGTGDVPQVPTGISAAAQLLVTDADTATDLRTGDVPVLATPRLLALAEEASCRALDGHLGSGSTTVATRVQFDHLVPVPVGGSVVAEATLDKVEGRRFVFTLSVVRDDSDHAGPVAVGRLTRVLVQRPAFLAKAGCPPSLTPGGGEGPE